MKKYFLAFVLAVNVVSGGKDGQHDTTVGDCWQLDWSWRETELVRTAVDHPKLTAWDANGKVVSTARSDGGSSVATIRTTRRWRNGACMSRWARTLQAARAGSGPWRQSHCPKGRSALRSRLRTVVTNRRFRTWSARLSASNPFRHARRNAIRKWMPPAAPC